MQKYEKYKIIHRISYIVFFSYLLILAVGNFDFGEYANYIPYFIAVPFLIYCSIAVTTRILLRKARTESYKDAKEEGSEYGGKNAHTLSNI